MQEFHFKKKYGQNFLRDSRIVERIVDSSNIINDTLVIEVGPGKGILTKELSKKAKTVLCYEIDNELESYLVRLSNELQNVDIIFDDFLKRDIKKDIQSYDYKHIYFISNVPYYITTPILMKLMDADLDIEKVVMMVQEEVGERFSAVPGKKAYSSLTVYLNYYYNIKRLFKVSRNEFIPIPNVDSEVVMFTLKDNREFVKNYDLFFSIVRDSFKFKRKTIKNNLKNYNLEIIDRVLNQNGLSLSSRAEQVPVSVYVQLSNALS